MWTVPPAVHSSFNSDFAREITRRFEHGRFLIIGGNAEKLKSQFTAAEREAEAWTYDDLASKVSRGGDKAAFETAVWLYPSAQNDDGTVADALSRCADAIILLPCPGADPATRRPQLVKCFGRFGFVPEYECDLIDLDPGAVCLRRQPSKEPGELVASVERTFVRLNSQLRALRRTLEIRGSELEGAQRHIAVLEEKLLKLKEYRRELRSLKEQRQTLRKSAERRIGQILLAPYRLPEKLAKAAWKKLHGERRRSRESTARSEYQKWLEQHSASAQDVKRMREEARTFASRPVISVITPVFNTSVPRLEEAIESAFAQAYENWKLVMIDDGSTG